MYALLYGFRADEENDYETTLLGVFESKAECEEAWAAFRKDVWNIADSPLCNMTYVVLPIKVGQRLWEIGREPGTVALWSDVATLLSK